MRILPVHHPRARHFHRIYHNEWLVSFDTILDSAADALAGQAQPPHRCVGAPVFGFSMERLGLFSHGR